MKRQFEDTDFDCSLTDLDSHFIWKKKQKQELKNRILTDIENLESNDSNKNPIINAINRENTNNFRFKKITYVSGIAVLLFVLLLGSGFVSPAMAKMLSKVPYLNSVLPYSDKGLEVANEKGLVKSIGQTAIEQGIPITITDVYYDNSRLEIGYSISLEQVELGDLKKIPILGISNAKIDIDGKEVDYSTNAEYKGDYITGTISSAETDLSRFSDRAKLNIEVTEALNRKGRWLFEFDIQKEQQNNIVNFETSTETEKFKFTVNNLQLTPSATKVEYEFEIPADLKSFNEHALAFKLLDESGNTFELIKTGMIFIEHPKDKTRFKSELYFEPIDGNIKTLKLIPSIKKESGDEQTLTELEIGLPINK